MQETVKKIAIVEDNADQRKFLQNAFEETEDFQCVSAYENAEDAIAFLPKSDVDIVIVDIGLGHNRESGIDCVQQVKELRPDIHFMMHTVFDQDNKIFESLKAGASGYLIKSFDENVIVKAVRELASGGSPMSPAIARKVTDFFFSEKNAPIKKMELLSDRENEVLNLLSKGMLYKEIGVELNITTGTVKQHIHKVYQKLHVQNRGEAMNKYLGRI